MKDILVLCFMIFLHIFYDYYLQGILASMKQKKWWQNQKEYKPKYKYDYIVALFIHSFSWSFMIMLPIAITYKFNISVSFIAILVLNTIIHCLVDYLKANRGKINLITEQTIPTFQILLTFFTLK